MLKYWFILLAIFLQVINADELYDKLSKKYNASEQAQSLKKWKKTLSFIQFDQVIKQFPFIQQNIEVEKLANLIQAGSCKFKNNLYFTRVAIVDNVVYNYTNFKEMDRFNFLKHFRCDPFINFLKFLTTKTYLPDMYFILNPDDSLVPHNVHNYTHETCRTIPVFVFDKNCTDKFEQNKFLIPDPHTATLSWYQVTNKLKEGSKEINWEDKDKRMFFRGLAAGPHYDINLDPTYDYYKYFHRGAFVELSFKYPEIIDARFTGSESGFLSYIENMTGISHKELHVDQIALEQHLKYKYILSADGLAGAWTRVQFVPWTNSLLFKTQSQYIQWYYDKMIPGVHFVQIRDDLSDLFTKWQQMQNNSTKAKQIIKNANEFAEKYLSVDSFIQVTQQILRKYAKVQNLTLSKQEKQLVKKGYDIQKVIMNRKGKPLDQNFLKILLACLGVVVLFVVYVLIQQKFTKKVQNRPYIDIQSHENSHRASS